MDLVALSIGNPQAIVLGPLPDDARFERLGAALERHALFPDRTNVEFVQVEAPDRLRIRIWERGVGPTCVVRAPARARRWSRRPRTAALPGTRRSSRQAAPSASSGATTASI